MSIQEVAGVEGLGPPRLISVRLYIMTFISKS
jgi:hypothetical protein